MAEPYVAEIGDRIRAIVPANTPVYHMGVPKGVEPPSRMVTYSFSSPTWVRRGAGIVNSKKDLHQVMCSIKVDAATADEAHDISLDIFWELTGFKPTNCGELRATVSGSWGRLEGQTRPHTFSQATIFYFNTNLKAR